MAVPAIFGKFFGRTASEAAGFAAGVATGPVLAPVVEQVRQEIWMNHAVRALEPADAAEIVAEDVEARDWGADEAKRHGYDGERFDALTNAIRNAPGVPELFELWRRDLITDTAFEHGLRKARLEPRWDAPLKALRERLLSLSDLANARQQGFVDTGRQHAESALQGLDTERADILFELSGLPLGVETMQAAANRDLVDRATFDQAIREGHTKTKYTDLAWALRQPILSATTYATLHLKGWISAAEMNAGGALHGYTSAQMNELYLSMGRPAAPGQMATAVARGVDGPDGRPMDRAQFLKGIQESDIRPEWGPMLWGVRYTYPPLFQINRLRQADAIDTATAVDWARKDRLAPEVVSALETYWNQGVTATADPHIGRAQTQLWGRAHSSYLAGEISEDDARTALAEAGVAAAVVAQVLTVWDHERELERKQLTPAQVKKAYRNAVNNPATGTAWTRDDALAALIGRGYSSNDANTFLDL